MKSSRPSNTLCVIPARGGSKRIPGKNIKKFCGKPIIHWSIEAARESGCFGRIIVSTDSEEIASVSRKGGAEVPFIRSPDFASDTAGIHGPIGEALNFFREAGDSVDYICCLLPTSPMVTPEDLRRGLDTLVDAEAEMSVAVTSFPYCIFRGLKKDELGRAVLVWPENLTRHSQEFPETFHDAGQFYWIDANRFRAEPTFFFNDAVPVSIPRHRVQDIDTLEDWEQAEILFRCLSAPNMD